jgi:hypothetical protein
VTHERVVVLAVVGEHRDANARRHGQRAVRERCRTAAPCISAEAARRRAC